MSSTCDVSTSCPELPASPARSREGVGGPGRDGPDAPRHLSIGRRTVLGGLGASVLATPAMAQAGLAEVAIPISSVSFASAGFRAADGLGLFAAHGLHPRFVVMDSANAATASLVSGAAKVVVSGPGELIAACARDQPVVVIADVYRGFGASLVLTREVAARTGVSPSAPAADRIRALDGLVIASASATSSYTFSYKGAAEDLGAKIRFAYMAQPAMVAALEQGAIQGMIASAPYWGFPIASGKAVLWLSGPKGDLPAAHCPVSSTSLQAMRPVADANPALMRDLVSVVRDLGHLVETQPEKVKSAVVRLYPGVDPATMDLLFAAESKSWSTVPFTVADMRHEIGFMRSGGMALPGLDALDPASMLYAPPA